MSDPANKKKGCGCCGGGCLAIIIIIVVLGALAYVGGKGVINTYASDSPDAIPQENATQAQVDAVTAKIKAYGNGDQGSSPLVLTAHELNIACQRNSEKIPSLKDFITIEGSNLIWHGSFELDKFGMPHRYLNGSITFAPSGADGVMHVPITEIKLKGKVFSDSTVKGFSDSFEQKITQDPDTAKVFARTQSLKVQDGALVFSATK